MTKSSAIGARFGAWLATTLMLIGLFVGSAYLVGLWFAIAVWAFRLWA